VNEHGTGGALFAALAVMASVVAFELVGLALVFLSLGMLAAGAAMILLTLAARSGELPASVAHLLGR
jgi:hypothetical protein